MEKVYDAQLRWELKRRTEADDGIDFLSLRRVATPWNEDVELRRHPAVVTDECHRSRRENQCRPSQFGRTARRHAEEVYRVSLPTTPTNGRTVGGSCSATPFDCVIHYHAAYLWSTTCATPSSGGRWLFWFSPEGTHQRKYRAATANLKWWPSHSLIDP